MNDGEPTMDGFAWSPSSAYVPMEAGEDGWCMRDAVCRLFGWSPGSDEWLRFIEGPQGQDTPRLADHLGLIELQIPQDWNNLIGRLSHPGVAVFDFHAYQKSHVVYVPDLRWLLHHWPTVDGKPARSGDRQLWSFGWPLGPEHMARRPVLGSVLIHEREAPRQLDMVS